jgi:hypothetical protein
MPAPRNCRSCGATLPPDVRWCNQCSEAVREFSARAPLHDGDYVGIPRHDVHTSRWAASPTTFGPTGRLIVTAGVVGLLVVGLFWTGATPFGLWFLAWSIVAGFVLRQTWQAVRVDVDPDGLRMRFGRRFPRLAAPLPLRSVVAVVGVCLLLATAYGWTTGDSLARFGIVIVAVMLGLTAILLWLTDS